MTKHKHRHASRHLPGSLTITALILFSGARLRGCDEIPPAGSSLTLSGVVSRMAAMDQARTELLQEYSSVRRYILENSRFSTSAEILVRMSYRQPGIKTFEVLSERGPGVIRRKVLHHLIRAELEASQPDLRGATRIAAENYAFTLVRMGEQNGRQCYILQAEPKSRTKHLFVGRIWVDAEDFAVVRIEGTPAVNPSFCIRKSAFVLTYRKVGSFWLPESNTSESEVALYGRTTVKIDYGEYEFGASAPVSDGGVFPEGPRRPAPVKPAPAAANSPAGTVDGTVRLFMPK